MVHIDTSIFEKQSQKFMAYVHAKDQNNNPLEFRTGNGVLAREEGYKSHIPEKARSVLAIDEWDESWIGSGKIKERICKAIDMSANLINFYAKTDFKNRFGDERSSYNAERAIYEIYKGTDSKAAFESAISNFGAKYPTIAYLFFIKDEDKYLPTSPAKFDVAFKELGIDFSMSAKCSWDNYCSFTEIIHEIGILMPKYMNISHEVRLLDAHSFVWILAEPVYMSFMPVDNGINAPLEPKNIEYGSDGKVRFQCPRCDYVFIKAKRCPVCGQLVRG